MKTSVVIPAYNEERNIGAVLAVLEQAASVGEVLVVDDGSTDGTARAAAAFQKVRLIHHHTNRGKSRALEAGYFQASGEIILFLDADLTGLKVSHVENLIEPVASGRADSTIGLFKGGRGPTDIAQKIAPILSGQRAFLRETLKDFPFDRFSGYEMEVALTKWARRRGLRTDRVALEGMSQVMKEEKVGHFRGAMNRLRMFWDILKALVRQS